MNSSIAEIEYTADDHNEFQVYRSVSVLAVVAVLLGLLSIVATFHPAGWAVAGVGVFVSAASVVYLTACRDRLAGRNGAVFGLCLSLFFGTWGIGEHTSKRYLVAQNAMKFATAWLEFTTRGELEKAHQATLNYRFRQPRGTDLRSYYANNEQDSSDMQSFFAEGIMKDLVQLGSDATINLAKVDSIRFEKDKASVVLFFDVFDNETKNNPLLVAIDATRMKRKGKVYWQLMGVADGKTFE